MPSTAKLYLIPVPIAENALHTISPEVIAATSELQFYFAENAKTARRFLRLMHPKLVLEPITISEIDKHKGPDMKLLKTWLKEGKSVGMMSEAGCPGIADPGAELAKAVHEAGGTVKPLTGPSSLLLALMASGLNGQSFCFNGYLPIKEPDRNQQIKSLEAISAKEKQTQFFIETPYRSNQLLEELLRHCKPGTQLCVAQNITASNEYIKTKTIAEWKKDTPKLEKAPVVFLMLG